ncbi:Proteasome subunit beta type-5 [Trichinella pseudospiralis]|uniref:proteasome endopeptidase complex n=1 Tax=Trichinella pseudospiralis TaxID=6337 RepID=A0A0V1EKQ9_TRIPS|nr:Proteasome subunit beta type-5 [Trichinella pseudospiralis]KRZ22584.1 Proteasome subunit beta type-5 [Trichinella pseudospiralis]KRZ38424.1 Proteasome subunit beta type-5 [Trichinella pseudospiralis]
MALASWTKSADVFCDETEKLIHDDYKISCFPRRIEIAPVPNVEKFVFENLTGTKMQMMKGTTTLAFIYKGKTAADRGGIMFAVDSRASSGKYICIQKLVLKTSSTVMKVIPLSGRILSTLAGGAADCQFWLRVISKFCKMYELRYKCEISVAAATKALQNTILEYLGYGLSMGMIVGGFNHDGPALYFLDSEGTRKKSHLFSCGSGSLNAYGILDTFYKPCMTDDEAKDLARRAIMHATYRDIGSGGQCSVFHLQPSGYKLESQTDVSDMYHSFMEEMKRPFYDPSKA